MDSPGSSEVPKPYVVESILYLARQGKSDIEIGMTLRRRAELIRKICADHSVKLRTEESTPVEGPSTPTDEHPYIELGRGVGRLEHARAILVAEGRLRTYRGREQLG